MDCVFVMLIWQQGCGSSKVERILHLLLLLLLLLRLSCAIVVGWLLGSHTEGVEWVLARWALRLICLHAHGHTTHHVHLLLSSHSHSLAHHWLESSHHWLEPTCCGRLLLLTWLLLSIHHLAEGIGTWQTLGLELISLSWLLLSLTAGLLRVESIKYW